MYCNFTYTKIKKKSGKVNTIYLIVKAEFIAYIPGASTNRDSFVAHEIIRFLV